LVCYPQEVLISTLFGSDNVSGHCDSYGMATPTVTDVSAARLTDSELMRALADRCERRRCDDADIARLSAEIAERSRSSLGSNSLASRMRASGAAALVVTIGRITRVDAARYVTVGSATAAPVSITGQAMEPRYPYLADALATGDIPMDAAAVIISNLDQASPRAHHDDLVVAEAAMAEFARSQPADLVRRFAICCRDRLDSDGIASREEDLVSLRALSFVELASGMSRLTWDLDPLSAATVRGFVDTYINTLHHTGKKSQSLFDFQSDGETDLNALRDIRTRKQMASDGMLELFAHVSNCPTRVSPMPKTTLVVRMTLDSLLTGLGEATVDGVEQPISAGTARRMAAEAGIIPIVMGGPSEILDLGREQRLFTPKQKLAILEIHPTCAACGRPPEWTEVHHIRWYQRDGGRTDIANAIPLCSSDHHAVHDNGWEITMKDGVPWFIPPSAVDIYRTPRRGHSIPRILFPAHA